MKKIVILLLTLVSLISLSSCFGMRTTSEGKRADERIEHMVSAIKDKDKEALKSLFSKKAIEEAEDFDSDAEYLFELIQGNIESWERDGWSSDERIDHGKKMMMIRYAFNLVTDEDTYRVFVIDYNIDTISPDNEGVYMLELIKFTDRSDLGPWQERMRAGIYIH